MYGRDGKTAVGTKYVSGKKAWDIFATWFNGEAGSSLTGKAMQSRCSQYRELYYKAQKFGEGTGSGLSSKDLQKGIDTIPKKRESMCYSFDRMDVLFGSSPNIEPLTQVSTSAKGITFCNKNSKKVVRPGPVVQSTVAPNTNTEAESFVDVSDLLEDDSDTDRNVLEFHVDEGHEGIWEDSDDGTQVNKTNDTNGADDVEEVDSVNEKGEMGKAAVRTSQGASQHKTVAFESTDFMHHRSKASSASTTSFPSVLRRANSNQSSSSSRKTPDARSNPPGLAHDISIKKPVSFGEAFMSSMEYKAQGESTMRGKFT